MNLDLVAALRQALADRYQIGGELGHGGMAVVCQATDLRYGREVAIKVLYPDLAKAVGGERFLREISILARLSHPNILPLLDSGSFDLVTGLAVPWYVMPLIRDETLRNRLDREGPLPVEVALRYTGEICSALAHAHAQGFIHRDIKPENILLQGGQAVLADFGIARAVTVAGGTTLTSTGLVVGTPAYMSPEQSIGGERLDPRSDLYSLGVVLYEMLAGHPPFTGATPQAISARHQFETPPPLNVVRPGLPPGVPAAVDRVLSKVAADRFQSAGEFAEVLRHPNDPSRSTLTLAQRSTRWWRPAAVGTLILAVFLVLRLSRSPTRPVVVDPARFVVAPLRVVGGAARLSGENIGQLIADALTHWTDVTVLSQLTVASALARAGGATALEQVLSASRALGAGRAIWGQISGDGDSLRIQVVLYETSGGSEVRTRTLRIPAAEVDLVRISASIARLTYAVVFPSSTAPEVPEDVLGTTRQSAWLSFVAGDSALNAWNLELAKAAFRRAVAEDPAFPQANLRLAQVGEWLEDAPSEWRPYAARAGAAASRLTESDRLMARGLIALADGQYPSACDEFRTMVRRDSLDFRGWFGLGECHHKDEAVVPDSGRGWRFRGSYHTAGTAYLTAVRLAPLIHRATREMGYARLAGVLYASARVREGRGIGADTSRFIAWQALVGDTLAFEPRRLTDVAGKDFPRPPTFLQAIRRNQKILLDLSSEWTADFPSSPEAWAHRSWELERQGPADPLALASSLDALDRSLRLGPLSRRLRPRIDRVRLLLKLGRYAEAASSSDSVLRQYATPTAEEARQLAALAALTGRLHRCQELLALAAPEWEFRSPIGTGARFPEPLSRPALALYANAVMGGAVDSFALLERQVYGGAGREGATLHALLDEPALYGFALNGLRSAHRAAQGSPVREVLLRQLRLATGQRKAAAEDLAVLRRAAGEGGGTTEPIPPENLFLDAWDALTLGDTVLATRALDAQLALLPRQSLNLLLYPQSPAFLVRAMALRATLADRAGDRATATRWASTVVTLWGDRDAELRPHIEAMSRLASPSH